MWNGWITSPLTGDCSVVSPWSFPFLQINKPKWSPGRRHSSVERSIYGYTAPKGVFLFQSFNDGSSHQGSSPVGDDWIWSTETRLGGKTERNLTVQLQVKDSTRELKCESWLWTWRGTSSAVMAHSYQHCKRVEERLAPIQREGLCSESMELHSLC